MSDWFSSSYMAQRGVARGRIGKTHQLTEAAQGSYQYVYGAYAAPVLTIAPGDVVVAETLDAFGGAITSVDDRPSQKLKYALRQPAERADLRRGCGTGRRSLRADRAKSFRAARSRSALRR